MQKKGISIVLILSLCLSLTGCMDGGQQELIFDFTIDSSDFPIVLTLTTYESGQSLNWNSMNITLTSQYVDPQFLQKEGMIRQGDILELTEDLFPNISKLTFLLRFNTSSQLLWSETIYHPVTTPTISFNFTEEGMVVESVDKIDYEWNLSLEMINFTYFSVSDVLYDPFKVIEVGDSIDLYQYELYGEDVNLSLIYNPTNERIGWYTINLTEPDPDIYLNSHELVVDDMVVMTYFYLYSGKTSFGTKEIEWELLQDLPSWLSASPMSGNFSYGVQRINLSFSPSGLTSGQHNHTIRIVSNYGNEALNVVLNKS